MKKLNSESIKLLARNEGFDLCGVVAATEMTSAKERFVEWLSASRHSTLGYMARNVDKRFDARLLVEGAESIVVCGVNYRNCIFGAYGASQRCKVASYAVATDYHTTIKQMLGRLYQRIRLDDDSVCGRMFVDSAPLSEKQLAVDAGFGFIGRQSLVVNETFGTTLLLGELVLNRAADSYDEPLANVAGCGDCRRCVEACPNGAICDDRTIDTRLCISRQTIEQQDSESLALGGWIFGCEECQTVCPYNNKCNPQYTNAAFDPRFDPLHLTSSAWRQMSQADFDATMGATPLQRSGLARLQRNAESEK